MVSKSFSPIFCLTLEGHRSDMATQHGQWVQRYNAPALTYYASFLERSAELTQRKGLIQVLSRPLLRRVFYGFCRRLTQNIPQDMRKAQQALAHATGLSPAQIAMAYSMPDQLMMLGALKHRIAHMGGLGMGCTSTLIRSSQGELLHARNLDFPGADAWTSHPALIVYRPHRGQPYMAIGALGVDTAGITGMNASGISLALHLNYSNATTLQGLPIVALGEQILAHATCLSDVTKILGQYQASSGWSFVVGSAREGSAAVFELDALGVERLDMRDPFLVRTNHYERKIHQHREYTINDMRPHDSTQRYLRATELCTTRQVKTLRDLIELLGDTMRPDGQAVDMGETICQAHTVCSVVMNPAAGEVWMAEGPSPTSVQPFVRFSVNWSTGELQRHSDRICPNHGETTFAKEAYAQAFALAVPYGHYEAACAKAKLALEASPNCTLYALGYAQLLMMCDQAQAARPVLDSALSQVGDHEPLRGLILLHQARALDLEGRHNEARDIYHAVTRHGSKRLAQFARQGIRRPWTLARQRRLILDLPTGDFMSPGRK